MQGKLPRLSKKAIFEDFGYQPHAGQWKVHGSNAPRRVLACGVRWGKTTCATMEGVVAALEPTERSMGWIVGPTYQISNRIFRGMLELLEDRVPHRLEEVIPREHRIRLRNLGGGVSELVAKSADNAVSLLGEGLDWLIVDEAARLKEAVWESHLSQRLLDREGWALLLSTPNGRNWFHRLHQRGRTDPHYASWNYPSWTNPTLPAGVIRRERERLEKDVFEQEYGAKFIGEGFDQCEVCGDPDPKVSGMVILEGDTPLVGCPACKAPVDASGHTLRTVLGGKPCLEVIRLYEGPFHSGSLT